MENPAITPRAVEAQLGFFVQDGDVARDAALEELMGDRQSHHASTQDQDIATVCAHVPWLNSEVGNASKESKNQSSGLSFWLKPDGCLAAHALIDALSLCPCPLAHGSHSARLSEPQLPYLINDSY